MNYPHSRLSLKASTSIADVCRQAQILQLETDVAIEARWRSEEPEITIDEYIGRPEIAVERGRVGLECARLIFPAVFDGYRASGISGLELWHITELEIEALVSGFSLSSGQRNLLMLEARFLWDSAMETEDASEVVPTAKRGRPLGMPVDGVKLKALRGETPKTVVARLIGIHPDTYARAEESGRVGEDSHKKISNYMKSREKNQPKKRK